MPGLKAEQLPIQSSEDIVKVRQVVRTRAVELGFSLVEQTKLITAASELARNTLDYGGGGTARVLGLLGLLIFEVGHFGHRLSGRSMSCVAKRSWMRSGAGIRSIWLG